MKQYNVATLPDDLTMIVLPKKLLHIDYLTVDVSHSIYIYCHKTEKSPFFEPSVYFDASVAQQFSFGSQ
jgi:hypothetical protein